MADPASAVTLPMPDVLAQAPEYSYLVELDLGDADLDSWARTIDAMEPHHRMLAMLALPHVDGGDSRTLAALASVGWAGMVSLERLRILTGRKTKNAVSQSLRRLVRDEDIWRDDRYTRADPDRIFFAIRAKTIHAGNRATTGSPDDVSSPGAMPDTHTTGSPDDVSSPGAMPDTHTTGSPDDVSSPGAMPDSLPVLFPGDETSSGSRPSRARAVNPSPRSSSSFFNIKNHDCLKTTTTTTEADDDSSSEHDSRSWPEDRAPDWWPRFHDLFGNLKRPAPPKPAWKSFLAFVHQLDSEYLVLWEACARFIDTYSNDRVRPAANARNVCRAIYQRLLVEWAENGYDLNCWASESWFAEPDPEPETEGPDVSKYRPVYRPSPMADPSARELWRGVLGDLQLHVPRPTFETWLKPTEGVADNGDVFVVEAPTPFAVEWLERRVFQSLQKSLQKVSGRPRLELNLRVRVEGAIDAAEYVEDQEGL